MGGGFITVVSNIIISNCLLRLIHTGETLAVTAAYEQQLECYDNLRTVAEAAYIEDYLTRKYEGVEAADLPLLTA